MITIATTYYDNPLMLREQIQYWNAYPDHVKEKVKIIVIDDGSPNHLAEMTLKDLELGIDICLVRIEQDIFQNTVGARNLAFTYADEGWVWNIDLDHVIPWQSMEEVLNTQLDPNKYYIPARRQMNENRSHTPIHRHNDTYIMTRELFWEARGYNEEFVEYYYNGPISLFNTSLKRIAEKVELYKPYVLYFSPEIIPDSSPLVGKEKKKLKNYREPKNGSWEILNFDYERVL